VKGLIDNEDAGKVAKSNQILETKLMDELESSIDGDTDDEVGQ